MRHFDLKHYPRERGKNVYTTLGGRLLEEIRYAPISINGCPLVRAEMWIFQSPTPRTNPIVKCHV